MISFKVRPPQELEYRATQNQREVILLVDGIPLCHRVFVSPSAIFALRSVNNRPGKDLSGKPDSLGPQRVRCLAV